MARWLAGLLMMSGLVLLSPPPAHAAVSVTIRASATTVAAGQSVTFSGKAINARRGSVVKLQRKVGTVWQTVARKRVWSARTYSFSTVPPRGYQYYRVVKPRQLGQRRAVSPSIRLTVWWRPAVTAIATHVHDQATGAYRTEVRGRVPGMPAGTTLFLQIRSASGAWPAGDARTHTASDGTFTDVLKLPSGAVARYYVPGSGARWTGISSPFTVSWAPYFAPLNSSVRVNGIAEPTPQTVAFDAVAGQRISLAVTDKSDFIYPHIELLNPAGQLISLSGGRFVAPSTGRYRVTFSSVYSQVLSLTLNVSVPKSLAGALDSSTQLSGDLPGQEVELTFTGEPGEVVTQYTPPVRDDCTTYSLFDPTGEVRDPWQQRPSDSYSGSTAPVWRLAQHGTHWLRYTPCNNELILRDESLWRADEVAAELDGGPAALSMTDPGRVALLSMSVTAGQAFTLGSSPALDPDSLRKTYFRPDGTDVFTPDAWLRAESADAGTYQVLLATKPGDTGTTTWWASSPLSVAELQLDADATPYDLGPAFGRELSFGIDVPPGQLFTIVNDHTDGSPCGREADIAWEGTSPFFQFIATWIRPVYQRWSTPLPGRLLPCSTAGSLRLVTVPDPAVLTIDGAPVELSVGQDGRPVLARVPVARGDQLRIEIDTSGLPEGANYAGSVGHLYPATLVEQYQFRGTASDTPHTVFLNEVFIEPELVVNVTTWSGIEGTVKVRIIRN